MLLFFDTEFTGLRKNTTLISLGIVAENDKTFYAEFNDYDRIQMNKWIEDNVMKYLKFPVEMAYRDNGRADPIYSDNFTVVGNNKLIKYYLTKWLAQFVEPLQLVSDACHYDMVLFIDIFGDAFSLPENLSPTCHDINQDIANYLNISEKEAFDTSREEFAEIKSGNAQKHNALWDAIIIKACHNKLSERT